MGNWLKPTPSKQFSSSSSSFLFRLCCLPPRCFYLLDKEAPCVKRPHQDVNNAAVVGATLWHRRLWLRVVTNLPLFVPTVRSFSSYGCRVPIQRPTLIKSAAMPSRSGLVSLSSRKELSTEKRGSQTFSLSLMSPVFLLPPPRIHTRLRHRSKRMLSNQNKEMTSRECMTDRVTLTQLL